MAFFLLSHVVYQNEVPIYGPVQVLEKFLLQKKQQVYKAFLPLYFDGLYSQTGKHTQEFSKNFGNAVSKYLYDVWYSFMYILRNKPDASDVIIAVDPLNCIGAVVLAPFMGFKVIYYTADYSEKRFDNPVINEIYYFLDQICLYFCDQNWCVSERIVEKRLEQGKKNNVYFIPNTPLIPAFKPSIQIASTKYSLLYVGRMDEQMNVHLFPQLVKALFKKNKQTHLTLIGGGPLEKSIKTEIKKSKLSNLITYLGPQPNDIVISHIRNNGIGLALYSGGNMWNMYGDSMKIREYQYFGLPVVTTEVPSNSPEINTFSCGKVLSSRSLTVDDMVQAIEEIQSNYKQFSDHTLQLTNQRIKEVFLQNALTDYLL